MWQKEIEEGRKFLNLFSQKLQEIQENQAVLAQNQELLARQNNKIIAALEQLDKELFEEAENDTIRGGVPNKGIREDSFLSGNSEQTKG